MKFWKENNWKASIRDSVCYNTDLTLKGHRWTLLLQLMVCWCSTEPCPPPSRCRAAQYSSMCGELGFSLQKHAHLVFDHLHSNHQALPADVADDLVFVPEFRQFCHEMSSDVEAVLLQAILFDSLRRRRKIPLRCAANCSFYCPIPQQRAAKNRWTNQQKDFSSHPAQTKR